MLAQVKVLVFHPVQPWLAYADVSQGLTVWDWSSQQVSPQRSFAMINASRAMCNIKPVLLASALLMIGLCALLYLPSTGQILSMGTSLCWMRLDFSTQQ